MDAIQESLNKMMETFNNRLDLLEEQVVDKAAPSPGSLADEVASLRSFIIASMRALQSQIAVLAKQVDLGEMRSRRKILLLHGVPEGQDEDTAAVAAKVVVDKVKITGFTASDISRCHRMGRATGKDRPRPILFKLHDFDLRRKIWASKSCLKGSGNTLSEFLTKTRHDVFQAARQRFGITNAWSNEGSVYVIGRDGVRHRVSSLEDLEAIVPKAAESSPQQAAPKVAASTKEARAKSKRAAARK